MEEKQIGGCPNRLRLLRNPQHTVTHLITKYDAFANVVGNTIPAPFAFAINVSCTKKAFQWVGTSETRLRSLYEQQEKDKINGKDYTN